MTETEKDMRLDRMEEHQKAQKEKIEDIDDKVTEIYHAVVGNRLMGNIGMAERLNEMELKMDEAKAEIKKLQDQKIEDAVYLKIIKRLGWVIAILFIGFIVNEYILKK